MTIDLWIYEVPPIDWWDGFLSIDEFINRLVERERKNDRDPSEDSKALEAFLALFNDAVVGVARKSNWEGDGQWYVGAIPDDSNTQLVFGVKQDNNGATYIASRIPLPHLNGLTMSDPVLYQAWRGHWKPDSTGSPTFAPSFKEEKREADRQKKIDQDRAKRLSAARKMMNGGTP